MPSSWNNPKFGSRNIPAPVAQAFSSNQDDPYGLGFNLPKQPTWSQAQGLLDPSLQAGTMSYTPVAMGDYAKQLGSRANSNSWLGLQNEKQRLEEMNASNQLAQASKGQTAQAMSNLGMYGGIRGGARERLSSQGAENALLGKQNILSSGMGTRAGLSIADEEQKQRLLSQLAGQEQNLNQFNAQMGYNTQAQNLGNQKFNIQNALQQKELENKAKLGAWGTLGQIQSGKYLGDQINQGGQPGTLEKLWGYTLPGMVMNGNFG